MGKKIELTDDQLQELLTVEESVETEEEVSEEVAGKGTASKNKSTLKTNKLKKKKVKAKFVEGEDEAEIEVYEDEEIDGDEELSEEDDSTEEVVAEDEEIEGDEELSEEEEVEGDEVVAEETEDDDEDDEEDVKEEKEVNIEEDMNALFNGENLSEEFMEKASTIFGAALQSHLNEEVSKLEEEYSSKLEESVKEINETLTDKINDYLDYVVEEWVKENEVAIEQGLRLEIMEDFMSDLTTLFENNNINIPTEKVDLVTETQTELSKKEDELNEEIEKNVELTRQISLLKKNSILESVTEGLTDTQIEKLEKLSEGVEFVDEDSYKEKLEMIRENYFPEDTTVESEIDEDCNETLVEEVEEEKESLSPVMESYVNALSRSVKK